MSRLILVRHGQTRSNVEKRLDTRLPGAELTDLGVEQASRLGRRMVEEERRVTTLVTSVATRARQTGEGIGDHVGLEVVRLEGIHETQVGSFEGRNDLLALHTFGRIYHGWLRGELDRSTDGGETGEDVLDRFVPVVERIRDEYLLSDSPDAGDVVVVSHSAAIRLVATHLAGIDPDFAMRRPLGNTESVELVHGEGGWACVAWAGGPPGH